MTAPAPERAAALARDAEAVVIGASAGGLQAVSALLAPLPASSPPILVVVHVPGDRPSLLRDILAERCALDVRDADDKDPIAPGTVLLAPPGYHLLVEDRGAVSLSTDPPVRFSRPSIDVLFESAARVFGPRLLGVVLTGGNDDGARGLAAILAEGGGALVESPETAEVKAMPQAALAQCPGAVALPAPEIGAALAAAWRARAAGAGARRGEEGAP